MTPEQLNNPTWRLANLYWITDERGEKVQFIPNAVQRRFIKELHSLNIVLKARQLGITTLCCLIYLDACLFEPNIRAAIIAHRMDDAKIIFRDKVKFPYENLPEEIRGVVPVIQDSADTLTFSNNSSIRVSVSARSGTLQYLHVSEFGKICALFPEKAREIVTGALNAVHAGQFVAIESTAEGQEGAFYDMAQRARLKQASGQRLTDLDYKFHFYPWWQEPTYTLPDEYVAIGDDDVRYFDGLKAQHGIELTEGQKRWWVKKAETQAGDMKREYPATPDEAFEQALEGAYFTHQLYAATKQGRIGGFPYDPRFPVNTFWDLGRNDLNTIWLHQHVAGFDRFIGYYENSGEFIGHYISWLREWAKERDASFGDHYLPHDGDRQSIWLEEGTMAVMRGLSFVPRVVERPKVKTEAINVARAAFAKCQFDESGCKLGLGRLRTYRKEWDDERGVWRDRPRHDESSHCFVGETEIITRSGICRIMDLPEQGEVLTRCGWRAYRNPRITRRSAPLVEVAFSDGSTVRCTPDHLFATESGWTSTRSLKTGSPIQSTLTRSHGTSTASYTDSLPKSAIGRRLESASIAQPGSLLSAQYLRDAIFTIETVIPRIICFPIWSACPPLCISARTGRFTKATASPGSILAKRPGKKLPNGIPQKRDGCGTNAMLSAPKVGQSGSASFGSVWGVVRNLRRLTARAALTLRNTVGTGVAPLPTERDSGNGSQLLTIANAKGNGALTSVRVRELSETADVWCLTVPGIEEFALSNGAVVHNCADAYITYACSGYTPPDAIKVKPRDMKWVV